MNIKNKENRLLKPNGTYDALLQRTSGAIQILGDNNIIRMLCSRMPECNAGNNEVIVFLLKLEPNVPSLGECVTAKKTRGPVARTVFSSSSTKHVFIRFETINRRNKTKANYLRKCKIITNF